MIVHMDNFALYGLNNALPLDGVYAGNFGANLNHDPDPNAPDSIVIHATDGSLFYNGLRFVCPTPETQYGACWRWWVDNLPTNPVDRPSVTFSNTVNAAIISITMNTLGGIDIRTGGANGAIVASTAGPVVTAHGWYHIEAFLDCSADGRIEVRVEGRMVVEIEDINLNTTCQNVFWGFRGNNAGLDGCFYKDVVVWNTQGTHNTDFLGSVLVTNLEPIFDVALNWTPNGAANGFSILDNNPPDDTKYIQADYPPPAAYVCALSDLPLEITSVRAVMTVVRAGKADGGDGSLQNGVISSGTLVNGSDRPITVAQTYWRDIFEEDPHTHAPWLPAAVNAITMQINRTT